MRLLLRATNWVGDVVMSLPALRALREGVPGATLTVLARPWVAELYRLLPEVDEVLTEDPKGRHRGAAGRVLLASELRQGGFDRAVILPTSFRSALAIHQAGIPERIGYRGELRSLLLTRAVRLDPGPSEHQIWKHLRLVAEAGATRPNPPDATWMPSETVRKAAGSLLKSEGWDGHRFVAVHAASFDHAAKRWELSRFAKVLLRLVEARGLVPVLLGSASEGPRNSELAGSIRGAVPIDLAGKTSLPDVLGVLAHAAVFLGNDSGLAHLAAAVGAPTVVIFGPTDPKATRPWDGPRPDGRPVRLRVVRRPVLCAPCRFRSCPIDHGCMAGVSVEDVEEAIEGVLQVAKNPR